MINSTNSLEYIPWSASRDELSEHVIACLKPGSLICCPVEYDSSVVNGCISFFASKRRTFIVLSVKMYHEYELYEIETEKGVLGCSKYNAYLVKVISKR